MTDTTPGAISAESLLQAIDELRSHDANLVGVKSWILDRAREIESTRTPATQDAVATRRYEYLRTLTPVEFRDLYLACQIGDLRLDDEVDRRAALSAAHHARKPKEK